MLKSTVFILPLWTCLTVYALENRTEEINTMTDLIDSVFKDYDRKLPPKHEIPIKAGYEQRVDVTVELYILSIFAISEIDMETNPDYSLSMYLRQRWKDQRLVYKNTLNVSRLVLDTSLFHKIWVPDLFIVNEKESDFHEVTVPNQYIHIYPDGTIQLSMRITGKFSCSLQLKNYPFDSQQCYMELESYGHSTELIQFHWIKTSLTVADNIELPRFKLINSQPYGCEKAYYNITYPCIGVRFLLQRSYAYYLIQIYVPSILVVVLSWVNFWLDNNAVPARITLALLTVLTLTTQSEGARSNLPPVSYVKAIDVWMAVCLAFVFLALIEFAIVNVQSRKTTRRRNPSYEISVNMIVPRGSLHSNSTEEQNTEKEDDEKGCSNCLNLPSETARTIDKISRVVFPVAFTLFNIFYWLYYFQWATEVFE